MSPAPRSPPPARAGKVAAPVNTTDVTDASAIKNVFILYPRPLGCGWALLKEAPMQIDGSTGGSYVPRPADRSGPEDPNGRLVSERLSAVP